jgi:uncharacterized protein YrrD
MILWQMTETIDVREGVGHSLRTFSIVKGQPVFETKSGMKIGEVCDLGIAKSGIVTGLLINTGVFFKQTRYLDIQKVASFGWDGVMIEDKQHLEKLKESPEYTFTHQNSLEGKLMLTKSGQSLGLLKDVYFQEEVGTIVGYEITDGFFSEITEGKQVIHSGKPLTVGKDAIIVEVNET